MTGDFNAEPDENFFKYLLDRDSYRADRVSCGADVASEQSPAGSDSPFVDSWESYTALHRQMHPVAAQENVLLSEVDMAGNVVTRSSSSGAELDPAALAEQRGYTFPACNPIKRIDFILVRNSTGSDSDRQIYATIAESRIVGKRPTLDTGW